MRFVYKLNPRGKHSLKSQIGLQHCQKISLPETEFNRFILSLNKQDSLLFGTKETYVFWVVELFIYISLTENTTYQLYATLVINPWIFVLQLSLHNITGTLNNYSLCLYFECHGEGRLFNYVWKNINKIQQ